MLNLVGELEKTLHIQTDELPWMESGPGAESRMLLARPQDNLFAIQYRAQPGVRSPLHRHPYALVGYTLQGRWGHDEQYLYGPGSFIFETPGVIHRFLNNPDTVTEVLFIGNFVFEFMDGKGEDVVATADGSGLLQDYLDKCAAQCIEPRFIG